MNYGCINQQSQYRVDEGWTPSNDNETKIVFVEPTLITDAEKVSSYLKKARIIVSYDLDLAGIFSGLESIDKDIAYFKSIVLLSKEDFDKLQSFKSNPIEFFHSEKSVTQHDRWVTNLVYFGGYSKDDILKATKGKESESVLDKLELLTTLIEKNKKKEEKAKKQGKIEEEIKIILTEVEMDKDESKDKDEDKPLTDEQTNPDTIFGLIKNEKLKEKIDTLSK
jgi:hypothetical protein